MLIVIACLVGVLILLIISELLQTNNVLKGEYLRKFVHISVGSFIAFWPWLMSWWTLRILGLLMITFVITNWHLRIFNYYGKVKRHSYGVLLLATAVFLSALLASQKIFFTIAILQVSLADGLAAIIGTKYGQDWRYKVFGQSKTVIGSMSFWLISLGILGAGMLVAHNMVGFNNYVWLLVLLPALLTEIENIGVFGIDNLLIPIITVLVLRLVQA